MSEEPTERLNNENNFQTQVLAGLAEISSRLTSIEGRLTSLESRMTSLEGRVTALENRISTMDDRLMALEEKVDRRLHETRPIWEAVLSRLDIIESKLDEFAREWFELRARMNRLEQRVPPAA